MLDKLTDLFKHFPGVGPRQARRFVYFLLSTEPSFRESLISEISSLKNNVKNCSDCGKFFLKNTDPSGLCNICTDPTRDHQTLMVVEKDVDLEAIERTGMYKGRYFVLSGIIPMNKENASVLSRITQLTKTANTKGPQGELGEIILALSATPEGEYTTHNIVEKIDATKSGNLKITKLGRGLSSGLELEYSDADTLKNALDGRTLN